MLKMYFKSILILLRGKIYFGLYLYSRKSKTTRLILIKFKISNICLLIIFKIRYFPKLNEKIISNRQSTVFRTHTIHIEYTKASHKSYENNKQNIETNSFHNIRVMKEILLHKLSFLGSRYCNRKKLLLQIQKSF